MNESIINYVFWSHISTVCDCLIWLYLKINSQQAHYIEEVMQFCSRDFFSCWEFEISQTCSNMASYLYHYWWSWILWFYPQLEMQGSKIGFATIFFICLWLCHLNPTAWFLFSRHVLKFLVIFLLQSNWEEFVPIWSFDEAFCDAWCVTQIEICALKVLCRFLINMSGIDSLWNLSL